jgi:hypothetical protein
MFSVSLKDRVETCIFIHPNFRFGTSELYFLWVSRPQCARSSSPLSTVQNPQSETMVLDALRTGSHSPPLHRKSDVKSNELFMPLQKVTEMSIHCVKLPSRPDADSSSSEDIVPISSPARHVAPQRADDPEADPFEAVEDGEGPNPAANVDVAALGLPALSMTSDPYLSPLTNHITATITRHRIWVYGVKGLKFSLVIEGITILVAKRRQKMALKTWLMSKSANFLLDSPDLAGSVIRQRTKSSFSVMSPRARRADGFRQALAAIRLTAPKTIVVGKDLWLPPDVDEVFQVPLNPTNSYTLLERQHQFDVQSVKNGAFAQKDGAAPCFVAAKQKENEVLLTTMEPLSLVQAFGLAIALFVQ